jgi:hypothetical protein
MSAQPHHGSHALRHAAQRLMIPSLSIALVACSSGIAAQPLGPVSVTAAVKPSVAHDVKISFHPRGRLPHGGYYYAVLVLVHYPLAAQGPPTPRCAVSSDMHLTAYGFPPRRGSVRLTLLRAPSAEGRWCAGGTYDGAVYAVPHKPSCSRSVPCYGASAEYGPCWKLGTHTVCGVVVRRNYSYPGGLPRPIDRSTRIVGHFSVTFAG